MISPMEIAATSWGSGSANDAGLWRQLPLIAKILEDETWLEGERRGCPVDRRDPVVVERVCLIVLTQGAALRTRAMGLGG